MEAPSYRGRCRLSINLINEICELAGGPVLSPGSGYNHLFGGGKRLHLSQARAIPFIRCSIDAITQVINGHTTADDVLRHVECEPAPGGTKMGVNPVVLEIIRGSLRSTIQEMELLMERCAMSPFIKEKKDYFVGIYDTRSRIVCCHISSSGPGMVAPSSSKPTRLRICIRAMSTGSTIPTSARAPSSTTRTWSSRCRSSTPARSWPLP